MISLTNLAKTAISGLGFSSQAYYQAWDDLRKKFGRLRVIVESQLKKINTYPQVKHDDSNGLVCFTNVVTNKVNVLTRLGIQIPRNQGSSELCYQKTFPKFKEQWLRYLQNHRLLAANLIVFIDWLESTSFIHKDLLAQLNSKYKKRQKPKQKLWNLTLKNLQNKRIQKVPSNMENTPFEVVFSSNHEAK